MNPFAHKTKHHSSIRSASEKALPRLNRILLSGASRLTHSLRLLRIGRNLGLIAEMYICQSFFFYLPYLSSIYEKAMSPHHSPLLLAVLLRLLPPLPLTLSGFFNGMLEVFEQGALNYFTFSCPILSTLSVSRNPILTPLPLSGFLDSLLCALIAPTPGLAFSLLVTHTLAAALSFSSGRAYPFLNFLHPLFLRLIPILIM